MTDSTTTRGWLHQSNFREKDKTNIQAQLKREVSRKHAQALVDNDILGYSQWFPGIENKVGNSLLWDHHLTAAENCLQKRNGLRYTRQARLRVEALEAVPPTR